MSGDDRARAAVVTGASRGIGRGIALELARRGWDLTLAARSERALSECAEACVRQGAKVRLWLGDMSDHEALESLLVGHVDQFDSLDGLVLAAGVGSAGPLTGYPIHRLDRQIDVNFRAAFSIVAQAIPSMRESAAKRSRGLSRIFLLGSLEGRYPESGLGAYAATKAALIALASSINVEEARNRIAATVICPGFVDTAMSEWVTDQISKEEMLTVEDVVAAVGFVLSLSENAIVPELYLHRRMADPYRA